MLDIEIVDDVMRPDIHRHRPVGTMIARGVRHLVVDGPGGGVVSIRAVLRSILS